MVKAGLKRVLCWIRVWFPPTGQDHSWKGRDGSSIPALNGSTPTGEHPWWQWQWQCQLCTSHSPRVAGSSFPGWSAGCSVFIVFLTKSVIRGFGVCCYLRLITVMKALSGALLRWHLPLFAADNIKLSDYSRLLSLQSKSTPLKCANKTHGSNKLERSVTAIKEHEGKCTAFATVIIFNLLRSNHFCNMVLLLGVNLIFSNTRLQSVFSVNLDVMHISALQSEKPPPWAHDHMVSTTQEQMSSTLHIHLWD